MEIVHLMLIIVIDCRIISWIILASPNGRVFQGNRVDVCFRLIGEKRNIAGKCLLNKYLLRFEQKILKEVDFQERLAKNEYQLTLGEHCSGEYLQLLLAVSYRYWYCHCWNPLYFLAHLRNILPSNLDSMNKHSSRKEK